MNISSFLWTSAGQKADGITPTHTHTHTRGGHQPCRLIPCHPSRLAPEEFRAITQQVGLPVRVLTVEVMTVRVLTVGSMGRPLTESRLFATRITVPRFILVQGRS